MTTWNPKAEPFRVCLTRSSQQRGCFGWSDSVNTFATLEQAIEFASKPFKAGVTESDICMAQYDDSGTKWKWVEVATRKRKQEVVFTKFGKTLTK